MRDEEMRGGARGRGATESSSLIPASPHPVIFPSPHRSLPNSPFTFRSFCAINVVTATTPFCDRPIFAYPLVLRINGRISQRQQRIADHPAR
jgi:hypothetical protein